MSRPDQLWVLLIVILLISALGIVCFFSYQALPSTQSLRPLSQTKEKAVEETSQRLCPPEKGIYYGAFPDLGGSEDIVTEKRITDFEKITEKKLLWVYFSNNWGDKIEFPKEAVEIIDNHGAIPFIRMMPWSIVEQERREQRYTLDRIKNGDFDQDLKRWAKQAKATKIPLLVDFAVEMNGEWFPWNGRWYGSSIAGAHKFRDSYRHIIDLFKKEQVENITWFFHFDTFSWPQASWNRARNYYPGDQYIDWLGISAYGAQTKEDDWELLSEIMVNKWAEIETVSKEKPIALLEFAVNEDPSLGDKAEWIRDAFKTVKKEKYSQIKAVSWWNESWENEDDSISDLRVNSSPQALRAYKRAIKDSIFVTEPNYCQ